jgi:hypothetical protein
VSALQKVVFIRTTLSHPIAERERIGKLFWQHTIRSDTQLQLEVAFRVVFDILRRMHADRAVEEQDPMMRAFCQLVALVVNVILENYKD